MTRKEAMEDLNYIPVEALIEGTQVELSVNMELTINSIYDDFENRNCTHCEYYKDEVCVNSDSRLCADSVNEDDICKLYKGL